MGLESKSYSKCSEKHSFKKCLEASQCEDIDGLGEVYEDAGWKMCKSVNSGVGKKQRK